MFAFSIKLDCIMSSLKSSYFTDRLYEVNLFSPAVCSISWFSCKEKELCEQSRQHSSTFPSHLGLQFTFDKLKNEIALFQVWNRSSAWNKGGVLSLLNYSICSGWATYNFIHCHSSNADEWVFEVWAHLTNGKRNKVSEHVAAASALADQITLSS